MDKYPSMCTIVAKKFPGIGWVGVKNRDRSLPTKTKLVRNKINGLERVTLLDEETRWTEGTNSNGVSVLSSSLDRTVPLPSVQSKNGPRIFEALGAKTVQEAVEIFKENRVSGCVLVFDQHDLWLIEGDYESGKQVSRKIETDGIARTNHGVWLPDAGYQPDSADKILSIRRISSESRLLIAKYIIETADSPSELMPLLATNWIDNPQMNTIRTPYDGIKTRTTEQLMIEPGKGMMLVRNIDGTLEFTREDANPPGSDVLVGIVQS